jgi:UDP-N-acetyl-D-glucosamine dehydrogenase
MGEIMAVPLLKERVSTAELAIMAPPIARLRADIVARRARVGIIGLGYVGLPLGTAFAEAGFKVTGFDVDLKRVSTLNSGVSHIHDVASSRIGRLVREGLFHASAEMTHLAEADVVVICVPTPLTDEGQPDLRFVETATTYVAQALRPGQLVILESTTYPGTTREVVLPQLEETGLRAGRDFFLAFSPERVDPGNPTFGITNTPKVTGGLDEESTELATLFYRQAIETVVPVSSPDAAEMVKLMENTFRSVNIGLANEMALICDRLGIDVWEVIAAAATKPFGFMPFYPGPGVGGHCIPLDPIYLAWKMRSFDYETRFINLASAINHERPRYVVQRTAEALAACGKSLAGANVLVLGVAYKPDIDDARESPAHDVIAALAAGGADVAYADPHVPSFTVGDRQYASEPLTAARLEKADCALLITNHRAFDYGFIARHARLIVDTRNAFRGVKRDGAELVRL